MTSPITSSRRLAIFRSSKGRFIMLGSGAEMTVAGWCAGTRATRQSKKALLLPQLPIVRIARQHPRCASGDLDNVFDSAGAESRIEKPGLDRDNGTHLQDDVRRPVHARRLVDGEADSVPRAVKESR